MPRSVASLSHSVLQFVHFILLPPHIRRITYNGRIHISMSWNHQSRFILWPTQSDDHIILFIYLIYNGRSKGPPSIYLQSPIQLVHVYRVYTQVHRGLYRSIRIFFIPIVLSFNSQQLSTTTIWISPTCRFNNNRPINPTRHHW